MGMTFDDALRGRATRDPTLQIANPQHTATTQMPIATPNQTPILRGSCVAAAEEVPTGAGLALAATCSVKKKTREPGGSVAFAEGTEIPAASVALDAMKLWSSSPTVARVKKYVTLVKTAFRASGASAESGTTTARETTYCFVDCAAARRRRRSPTTRNPTTVVCAAVESEGRRALMESDTLDATPLTASAMLVFEALLGAAKPTEKFAVRDVFDDAAIAGMSEIDCVGLGDGRTLVDGDSV